MADKLRAIVRRMDNSARCRFTSRASTSITRADLIEPMTSTAKHSLVYSLTTVEHLICGPAAVVSNTKS